MEAPKLQEGWVILTVDVSKKAPDGKGGQEYAKIGEMSIPIPTLEAFGLKADRRARTEADGEEDGLPLYADEKLQWLFDSVVAACKADARNKLIPQTASLKDDAKIASTFEELIADGRAGRGGEHLKIARECVTAFQAWFTSLGKSVAATAMATKLFAKKDALSLQNPDIKQKMHGYLSQFTETLEPANAERYSRYLISVEEACAATNAEDF